VAVTVDYTISVTQIITALAMLGAWLFAMGKIYQLLTTMQESMREHNQALIDLFKFREDANVRLAKLEVITAIRKTKLP